MNANEQKDLQELVDRLPPLLCEMKPQTHLEAIGYCLVWLLAEGVHDLSFFHDPQTDQMSLIAGDYWVTVKNVPERYNTLRLLVLLIEDVVASKRSSS